MALTLASVLEYERRVGHLPPELLDVDEEDDVRLPQIKQLEDDPITKKGESIT